MGKQGFKSKSADIKISHPNKWFFSSHHTGPRPSLLRAEEVEAEGSGCEVWAACCSAPVTTCRESYEQPRALRDLPASRSCPPPPLIEMSTFCLIPCLLGHLAFAGLSIEQLISPCTSITKTSWGCIKQVRGPSPASFLFFPPPHHLPSPSLCFLPPFSFPSLHLPLSLHCLLQALR